MQTKKHYTHAILCTAFFAALAGLSWRAAVTARQDSTGYTPDPDTEYLVTQYADATGAQGTFYTITNNDTLIVIDGGWAENADAVRDVIAAHGNEVDAWILSHPHRDHAGAFNEIYADPDGITIRAIYDNGFDYDFVEAAGEPYDDITVMETYYALTKDAANVTHLQRGDTFTLCGLTFSVLNAWDDLVLEHVGDEKDYQNNASLLLKVRSAHSSMLFCSDIKYDMNDILLETCKEQLACDYVQVGHHGNWSFSTEFYEQTGASVYFIDAPASITESADFPASTLAAALRGDTDASGAGGASAEDLPRHKGTVLDFRTAPNSVTLK